MNVNVAGLVMRMFKLKEGLSSDDVPPISIEGYALTHEEVMQMLKEVADELSETRKELGYTK